MQKILMIGSGGFMGALARYWVAGWVQTLSGSVSFPWGTMTVNVLGCLLIGFLSQLAESYGLFASDARALVFIGFIGSFTTFSTFSNETWNLLQGGEGLAALGNLAGNLLLGLGAVWLGRSLALWIWS